MCIKYCFPGSVQSYPTFVVFESLGRLMMLRTYLKSYYPLNVVFCRVYRACGWQCECQVSSMGDISSEAVAPSLYEMQVEVLGSWTFDHYLHIMP